MKRLLLSAAVSACFAVAGTAVAQTDAKRDLDRPLFKEDSTSDVVHDACPDYFDTDWALTNGPDDPCWDAYLKATDQTEAQALKIRDGNPVSSPSMDERTAQSLPGSDATADAKQCDERDLSSQAVAQSHYQSTLNEREAGDKESLSSDFDPTSKTAKSVAQLRDSDIEQRHLAATFVALDDNQSEGIDKIEALDVRGLADEFSQIDLTGDNVISHEEFHLYFGERLADNNALCLNGERITSLEDVDQNRLGMR